MRKLENETARYIPQNVNCTAGWQKGLLELWGDGILKERFVTSLTKVWAEWSRKPVLSNEAENALLPFVTTYLC